MRRMLPWLAALAGLLWVSTTLRARPEDAPAGAAGPFQHLPASEARIPRTFLNMARSIEGQREMGVQGTNVLWLDNLLREIDAEWVVARARPESSQHEAMAALEGRLARRIGERLGSAALQRLHQLEVQAQGGRALLRDDVTAFLALTLAQRGKIEALVSQTEEVAARARSANVTGKPDLALMDGWQRLRKAEDASALRILTPDQATRWREALGTKRDTSKFQRVQPMAPEFPTGTAWLDGKKARMSSLLGKVVLVHFYAFQCHNCHANFATYNRWQRSLREKGVEVVGIQTPETDADRDPRRIAEAARGSGFDFPVLMDLQSEAWRAWGNSVWPTVYVVDRRGYVRHAWVGELNWQGARGDRVIERVVDTLLAEDAAP